MTEPSAEEWKRLYDAAVAFRDLACWQWMYDSDLFAVQDPEGGETGYCVVMGNLGEFLGLAVYRGAEGLACVDRIFAEEDPEDPFDVLYRQKCLIASFMSRNDLDKRDLAPIRHLGLRFRGRTAWPEFRSHLPGYAPWYLDTAEVRFLAVALEQAVDTATRYRDDRSLLNLPVGESEVIFTRVPIARGDEVEWEDQWLRPDPPPEPEKPPAPVIDTQRLNDLERSNLAQRGVWEMDLFPYPGFVEEGDRPFIPLLLMCIDQDSGFVFVPEMCHPREVHMALADSILGLFEKAQARPKKIVFRSPQLGPSLEIIAPSLGIAYERANNIPILDEARASMREFFAQRPLP